MQKQVWLVGGAVALICAAVLLFSWRAHRATPAKAPIARTVPESTEPAIQNPVPVAPSPQPLPSLEESDVPFRDSVAEVIGKTATDEILRPELLVRHIVVTIDNLSRKRIALELRPIKPVPGKFKASGDDQHSTLDPANFQRYTPYAQVVQKVDAKQLAALYVQYYPLFQQAYQNLGYPNGYFNDRLVETIDNLLATPDVSGEIALVRPNVMYQFADPKLEELSAGQKMLLRMGPVNAAIVKAKLRELRAQIANRSRDRAGGN